MAYPAREVNKFRICMESIVKNMRDIEAALSIIDEQGEDDDARIAFFTPVFGADTDNPDITFVQFAQAIIALRNVQTAIDANKVAIAALLQ